MSRSIAILVLFALAGCQLTLGADTGIGNSGHVGTRVTVDPESGDTSTSVGGSVTVN